LHLQKTLSCIGFVPIEYEVIRQAPAKATHVIQQSSFAGDGKHLVLCRLNLSLLIVAQRQHSTTHQPVSFGGG